MAKLKDTQIYGNLKVDGEIMNKATTTSEGVVKLNDTVTSSSTTEAATAKAVKTAYDLAATKANSSHTHNYAGSSSAGGAATTALACTGNSATATTLATARTINGTSFNGSANITTANWGTARTITIGNTGKSVNGSANVSWSLTEIGAIAQPTNITGVTVDVDTYNLSSGQPKKMLYVETTTGGASNISNIPVKEPFMLEVENIRFASSSDYVTKQTFTSATTRSTYERWCYSGSWTAWLTNARMTTTPTSGQVLISDGTDGGIKTSGYTIAKSVPSNAVFTDTTYSTATTSTNGLMSSSDKTKLDGATNANTASKIVMRDASGNFSAGTITASLSGNASTATKLATARTINGTSFNGSANITTANWGTARTITIGNTGKSVNGSANVSWSLSEIGAAATSHTHTKSQISDFPTSLPANGGNANTVGGYSADKLHKVIYLDGEQNASVYRESGTYKCTKWVGLPPDQADQQGIIIVHNYSGNSNSSHWTHQEFISPHTGYRWIRHCNSNSWSDWRVEFEADQIIGESIDLNNILRAGMYYCPLNATAQTLSNCPTAEAFSLLVQRSAGYNQMITSFNPSSYNIWHRVYYPGVGWSAWAKIYHSKQINHVEVNGNIFGTASGHGTNDWGTAAGARYHCNIKFYDYGENNWAGIGTDSGGNIIMRQGTESTNGKTMTINNSAITWGDVAVHGATVANHDISGQDLNNFHNRTGVYKGNGCLNAPPAMYAWIYLDVKVHAPGSWVIQTAWDLHDASRKWVRTLSEGSWGAWVNDSAPTISSAAPSGGSNGAVWIQY